MRGTVLVALFSLLLLATACGGGSGAVIFQSPTGRPDWVSCQNDWDREEVEARGEGEFHQGRSCDDLGFTKSCPGETGAYRLQQYEC